MSRHQAKANTASKIIPLFIIAIVALVFVNFSSLGDSQEESSGGDFKISQFKGPGLRIVAGSENKELEPIIKEYAEKNKVNMTIDYLGSLDIMRQLQSGQMDYDAVWPASNIWLTLGDDHKMLKHGQTTSISPVVFGIKKSLAEELGFVGKDVYIKDIIQAIKDDKLDFAMTSATQSNSGASAYLGFLTAIAGSKQGLTMEELKAEETGQKVEELLAGVNRSSGSSNWLVDLFLSGDYDAMVNYETLIIKTNQELEKAGKEPLYMVYPVDGLSISDSPLAYVDHGKKEVEDAFLDFQEYILSDEAQSKIEATGKRSRLGTVEEKNRTVFKSEWGVNLDKVISPIHWPNKEVIAESLNLYQTQFKKPALTVYVLDYSGSMSGRGQEEMMKALDQIWIPEQAQAQLLQGTPKDISLVIPFASDVQPTLEAVGNSDGLLKLNKEVHQLDTGGNTYMYEGIAQALEEIKGQYGDKLDQYVPAIVVLTDGMPNGDMRFDDLEKLYKDQGQDIPIFSILFAEAEEGKMKEIADLTHARVFDGRKNLVEAFKQVKGYN